MHWHYVTLWPLVLASCWQVSVILSAIDLHINISLHDKKCTSFHTSLAEMLRNDKDLQSLPVRRASIDDVWGLTRSEILQAVATDAKTPERYAVKDNQDVLMIRAEWLRI